MIGSDKPDLKKKLKWFLVEKQEYSRRLFNNSAQETKQKHFRARFPPFAPSDATFTVSFNYGSRCVGATGLSGLNTTDSDT